MRRSGRDNVESFLDLLQSSQLSHFVLGAHFLLDGRWGNEESKSSRPKRLHQRTILDFGNYLRVDFVIVEPLIEGTSEQCPRAWQKHRRIGERVGKFPGELGCQRGRAEDRCCTFTQQMAKRPQSNSRSRGRIGKHQVELMCRHVGV